MHFVFPGGGGEVLDRYSGQWLNDLQSGDGTEEWSDGACYAGEGLKLCALKQKQFEDLRRGFPQATISHSLEGDF